MLKKIGVSNLRAGMFLHELCGSWIDHPFWRTAFLLENPDDIERIAAAGITEVWIDTGKGLDIAASETRDEAERNVDETFSTISRDKEILQSKPVTLSDELQRAGKIVSKSREAITTMFAEARMGKALDANQAMPLVEEISGSIERNPGAIISLARLKTKDNYTYMHSVAVCALMVSLARQLGLNESDTREAGLAGLLHDVGKMTVADALLNKPGKLTDEEFMLVKSHPEAGHQLLLEGNNVSEIALDVCLHHHEKVDGSGYPHRLKGKQITQFAKMGAVCDVYDAITSDRAYKRGWEPHESLRKMADWSRGHFDEIIFRAFVKCVGIYPVGTLVRLSSGRLAIVIDQGKSSLLTPTVKAFFSTRSRERIVPEVIDLALPRTRERIECAELAAAWGLENIESLWMAPTLQ